MEDWQLAGLDGPPEAIKDSEVDWKTMRPHYELGLRSLRDLGAEFCCTEGAIRKHAKKYGWTQDLNNKVIARAEAMVRSAEVKAAREATPDVGTQYANVDLRTSEPPEYKAPSPQIPSEAALLASMTDEEVAVEVQAVKVARVLVGQRRIIQRHAEIACKLLDELEATTDNQGLFNELGEMLRSEDERGNDKRNDIYNKVISMGGRIDSFKKLSESLKVLVALERQAVGLSDNGNGEADKPPVQATQILDNDAARRIAFVLRKHMQNK
jgi:hypothetical protein